MYSLIIADDEPLICDGISAAIESLCPNVKITNIFNNGEELLDYISKNHTDIIISDIRMGTISGIDIAKYVSEHLPETHMILITGYQVFEYAHSAINYHIDYMLTKPVSSKDLINAVNSIVELLDSDFEAAITESRSIVSYWGICRSIIKNIFQGNGIDKNISLPNRFINFEDQICEICCIIYEDCEEITENRAIDIGEYCSNNIKTFFCGKKDNKIYFASFFTDEFDKSILGALRKSIKMVYGVSADFNCEFFENIFTYSEHCKSRVLFQNIITLAKQYDPLKALEYSQLKTSSISENEKTAFIKYISSIRSVDIPTDVNDLDSLIKEIINRFSNNNASDSIAERALRYISEHYLEYDLSLSKIAESLDISQEHLSREFKEYSGIGFKAYLQNIRIEKAKKLLTDTNKSSSEIANTVGYSSVSHFKQIFKKSTGHSLAEYRNGRRKNDN